MFVSKFAAAAIAGLVLMSGNAAFAISGTPAQLCAEARNSSASMDRALAYIATARAAVQVEIQALNADIQSHQQAPPEDRERQVKQFTVREHAIKNEVERINDFELCIDKSKSVF